MSKQISWMTIIACLFSVEAMSAQRGSCHLQLSNDSDSSNNKFENCWYTGVGYGLSHLNPDENDSSWTIQNKDDAGLMLYVGNHFKPNWFAEIAYHDLGKVSATDNNPLRNTSGIIRYKVPTFMMGYYVDIPSLIDNSSLDLPFETYIKLGLSAINSSADPDAIPLDEQSNVQLAFGFGIEWRFHQHWKLRGQYESFDVDARSINISVAYIFNNVKPIPEPVIPEKISVKPVVPDRICKLFSGSLGGINFSSGKDTLTEESKITLLDTIAILNDYDDLTIEVQAHTDWKGKGPANQELSDRRAASVRIFMVQNGVSKDRVTSVGYGEMQPIADNRSEEGRAKNRRVELKPIDNSLCE